METPDLKNLTSITSIFQGHFFDFLDKRSGKELLLVNKQIFKNVKSYTKSRIRKYGTHFETPIFEDAGGCFVLNCRDNEIIIPKSESVEWVIKIHPKTNKETYFVKYLDDCYYNQCFSIDTKEEFIALKESYSDYIAIQKSKS
jgi:hypothetical protein